jgi:hypothetical protein
MPQPPAGSPVNAKLQTAKNVLSGAKSFSKSADPTGSLTPKPVASPIKAEPKSPASSSLPPGINSRAGNIAANRDILAPGDTSMPVMHDGGTVQKTGPAYLQKGEEVISAKNGRASEYRKVYLGRKQKKSAGE